jgi:hypothetical protein
MRFACQSCGKAYNLPEERIADKSNVKLKCRVCGAIVEVKKQGEMVAHLLDEADAKRLLRVSEAPAPLTSITPDDDDDPDGATVSISEASINDRGPLELEMPVMPAASPTGFGAPLAASAGGGARLEASVAPPLPPPPLSPSSLPPPPPLRSEASAEPAHASNGAGLNGSATPNVNGAGGFFPDAAAVDEGLTPELRAPVAPTAVSSAVSSAASTSTAVSDIATPPEEMVGKDPAFKLKMAAAFVTGVLIDRIVSGLFN